MPRRIAAISVSVVLALGAAACGGNDDESSDTGTEVAESVGGGESYDITAEEFVASTDKQQILDDFAADNPECEGAIDQGFLLDISARATNLPPDAPIADEILDACTPASN